MWTKEQSNKDSWWEYQTHQTLIFQRGGVDLAYQRGSASQRQSFQNIITSDSPNIGAFLSRYLSRISWNILLLSSSFSDMLDCTATADVLAAVPALVPSPASCWVYDE